VEIKKTTNTQYLRPIRGTGRYSLREFARHVIFLAFYSDNGTMQSEEGRLIFKADLIFYWKRGSAV
jgi:hypothetical protein